MNTERFRIFGSFSGGRSSAVMCKRVLELYPNSEKLFIFANTGEEHWKTLEYVNKVDQYLGLNLVWVEAEINPVLNEGTSHVVVTFQTASRKGEPYEAVIQKYGIPNKAYPHCNRELKTNPMYSYLKEIGWERGSYQVAIGIRADEPKRIDEKAKEKHIFYPLVEEGIDKRDVLDECATWPFDLGIEEREGNCKWCWKKSDTKHILNIQRNPEWYEFPKLMEQKYDLVRTDLSPDPRVFFRGKRSTQQMIALANAVGVQLDMRFLNREDEDAGCSEECGIEIE